MIICDICSEEKRDTQFYLSEKDKRNTTCIKCFNKLKSKETLDHHKRKKGRAPNSYIFLQYSQLMYNHIKKEYNINYEEMNLMLLLYPVTPFDHKEFVQCKKLADYRETLFLKRMMEEGWMFKRRQGKYNFTDKGHKLMIDAHRWAMGKKYIPDTITEDVMDIIRKIQRRTK